MNQAHQLQALKIYQELYSADHPDVIECLNNLAYINGNTVFETHSLDPQLFSTQIQ